MGARNELRGDPTERSDEMAHDLLIKNGRIIDGSGRPAFHGDHPGRVLHNARYQFAR
jgi:hypothetical protein